MLIVDPQSEPETITDEPQMTSGSAADIDHVHALHDHIVKKIELGAHEGVDLGGLHGRIQHPIQ
jgi:hypothetical protein